MGERYLADTNTLIDYLQTDLPVNAMNLLDEMTAEFSVITRMELLVWRDATSEQVKVVEDLILNSIIFPLDENVILKAIEIRKNYRLKLPDAIIAATAVVNNLELLTRNIKDFRRISGLTCVDPYTM
jgi:predicted nucleic acid-binding protein